MTDLQAFLELAGVIGLIGGPLAIWASSKAADHHVGELFDERSRSESLREALREIARIADEDHDDPDELDDRDLIEQATTDVTYLREMCGEDELAAAEVPAT